MPNSTQQKGSFCVVMTLMTSLHVSLLHCSCSIVATYYDKLINNELGILYSLSALF